MYKLVPILVLTLAVGCTQLSEQDRTTLSEASGSARAAQEASIEARNLAQQALQEAQAARQEAAQARASAQTASDRADRIFNKSQNK